MKKMQPLVIGIGNEFRGDDAAGIVLVRQLKQMHIKGIDIIESSGEGTELMRLWEDYETVFVIDAVRSGNRVGEIYRFTCRDIEKFEKWFRSSSHLFSLPQALQLAKEFGTCPKNLLIFGIEGASFEFTESMTPEVVTSIGIVSKLLLQELTPLIPSYSPTR